MTENNIDKYDHDYDYKNNDDNVNDNDDNNGYDDNDDNNDNIRNNFENDNLFYWVCTFPEFFLSLSHLLLIPQARCEWYDRYTSQHAINKW